MSSSISIEQLRLLRMQHQGLTEHTAFSDVAGLIQQLGGLQSQELPSAYLAIRARTKGLTLEDVKKAREVDKSIVLIWAMRGTMHLVLVEDLSWLLGLFGDLYIRKGERRYKQLGLSKEIREKAAKLIQDILSNHGSLTRPELAQALAQHGIPVAGQAIAHLVAYAALSGIICFGAEHNGKLSYVLLEDWLKSKRQKKLNPQQSLEELARRYFQAYAPATIQDFANWSGLAMAEVKTGFECIADELLEVSIESESAWMLKTQMEQIESAKAKATVRLLPRYDNYLLGHQNRDFMVNAAFAKHIHPGGGLIRTSVIVDGEAKGIWRLEERKNIVRIIVQSFEEKEKLPAENLEAEVEDIGYFLGKEASLEIEAL